MFFIKKKKKRKYFLFSHFLLLLFSFLSIVSLTYAATTIGNDIFTSGTITSQGKAYLTGGVSTPILNATSSLIDNLSVDQNALLSQATIPTLNATSSLIDNLNVKVNLAVQGLTQLATTTSFNINKVVIVDGKHYPANSTGIQEAIDSLGPEGGKVFLPAGTYPITATTTLPSNVWLQGAGASSTILYLANNANTSILTNSDPVNGNSHIKISDLMIYGNKINNTNSDNNGVLFTNVTNSKIVDTRVKDCHNVGIFINPGSNNVIERNEIENNGAGVAIYQNTSLENAVVGNRIERNSGDGIELGKKYTIYGGQKNLIKGNIIINNYNNGMSGYFVGNSMIVNNQITGNYYNNISFSGPSINIIEDNIVCDAGIDNIGMGGGGSNIIGNNYFCSPGHYNFNMTYSYYNIILNNYFREASTDLFIADSSYYTLLSGNHFSDAVVDDSPDTIYSSQPLNNGNIILKSIGNVGIGTTTPAAALTVVGDSYLDGTVTAPLLYATSSLIDDLTITNTTTANHINLPDTIATAGNKGIIYKDGVPFLYDFSYGTNAGGITPYGSNLFLGKDAGNLTMGSTAINSGQASYNTVIGQASFECNTTGSNNTAVGRSVLYNNTTGFNNTAIGINSLFNNTIGNVNTAQGVVSLFFNTSGYNNVADGGYALYSNTIGYNNVANGYRSLFFNTSGYNNVADGGYALYSNTIGYNNVGLGNEAGQYTSAAAANATSTYSLYLGANTQSLASGDTNEIVIGDSAVGAGSNSVVLGNDNIAKTLLKGNVGIGTTTPGSLLDVSGESRAATSTITIGSGSSPACLKLRDADGLGWTYCDFQSGAMYCTTTDICD